MGVLAGVVLAISADTGSVFVKSSPPGAQIYLDGAKASSGATPTEVRDLSPGKHEFRIVFPDAREVVREITVQPGGQTTLSASWNSARAPGAPEPAAVREKARAVVKVESAPAGARVTVGGRYVGKSPCTARGLSEGTHKFVLRKSGYESHETLLDLKAGETRTLQVKLESTAVTAAPGEEAPEIPKIVDRECPMCEGRGHMLTMGCPTCKHTGYNLKTIDPCHKCGGQGTLNADCGSCRGAGAIQGRACPTCDGSGKSNCPLCKGKGKIQTDNRDYHAVKYEIVNCPNCRGSGVDGRVIRCKICSGSCTLDMRKTIARLGAGRTTYFRRTVSCWYCNGTGEERPPCPTCRGKGYAGRQATWGLGGGRACSPCLSCGGTGKLFAFCQACGGRGWIKKRKKR